MWKAKKTSKPEALELPIQYREATISELVGDGQTRAAIDEESRTVELVFSSEEPIDRFYGVEILDHGAGAVRLERLNGGGAGLVGHDPTDHVAVVERAWIDAESRVGRASVRFGKSARASEIFQDVVDGIRRHVSVGYRVHRMILEEENEGSEVFRVVDWEPTEVSIVSIPADATVGVGREEAGDLQPIVVEWADEETRGEEMADDKKAQPEAPTIDTKALREEAQKTERERVDEILRDAREFDAQELADQAIREGWAPVRFQRELFKAMRENPPAKNPLNAIKADGDHIGMSDDELRKYSIFRAVRAYLDRDWTKAGLERAASQAVADQFGEPRGFYVPPDVLARTRFAGYGQRDTLITTTDDQGGYLVETAHAADSFVDALRNVTTAVRLGARMLPGLVGTVDIPTLENGALFYWIDNETTDVTEDAQTEFGNRQLSPKTIAAKVPISRKMLKQSSPSVEAVVREDLIAGAAVGIDAAVYTGSGASGQPTGIQNISGVGAVVGGDDGAALTWTHVVNLKREVRVDNAVRENCAYVINGKTEAFCQITPKETGYPVYIMGDNTDRLAGFRYEVTEQMPGNLTKGAGTDLSLLCFGNHRDILIGMWGGLDLKPDEITNGDRGGLILRAFQDIDVVLRHPESFAIMEDADCN